MYDDSNWLAAYSFAEFNFFRLHRNEASELLSTKENQQQQNSKQSEIGGKAVPLIQRIIFISVSTKIHLHFHFAFEIIAELTIICPSLIAISALQSHPLKPIEICVRVSKCDDDNDLHWRWWYFGINWWYFMNHYCCQCRQLVYYTTYVSASVWQPAATIRHLCYFRLNKSLGWISLYTD